VHYYLGGDRFSTYGGFKIEQPSQPLVFHIRLLVSRYLAFQFGDLFFQGFILNAQIFQPDILVKNSSKPENILPNNRSGGLTVSVTER
jgi:hypothetical protein